MSVASMRRRVRRLLPDTCSIERRTTTSDGGGGLVEAWTNAAIQVPCFLEPVGGGENGRTAERIDDETTHVAYVQAGTDITEADRLVIAGQRYDVTAVHYWGQAEVYRAVELVESDDSTPLVMTPLIWGESLWNDGNWE